MGNRVEMNSVQIAARWPAAVRIPSDVFRFSMSIRSIGNGWFSVDAEQMSVHESVARLVKEAK